MALVWIFFLSLSIAVGCVEFHIVLAFMGGVAGASFWKVHHLNERRKTEEFYARLEAGEITVQAQE